jgi:hypothetical protein
MPPEDLNIDCLITLEEAVGIKGRAREALRSKLFEMLVKAEPNDKWLLLVEAAFKATQCTCVEGQPRCAKCLKFDDFIEWCGKHNEKWATIIPFRKKPDATT